MGGREKVNGSRWLSWMWKSGKCAENGGRKRDDRERARGKIEEKKEGIVLPVSLNKHRVILWLNIIETA